MLCHVALDRRVLYPTCMMSCCVMPISEIKSSRRQARGVLFAEVHGLYVYIVNLQVIILYPTYSIAHAARSAKETSGHISLSLSIYVYIYIYV